MDALTFPGRVALTAEEFADAIGTTARHIRNEIDRGRIRAFKVGRCVRIPRTELERLLAGERAA